MVLRTTGTGPVVGSTSTPVGLGSNLGSTASWLHGENKSTYLVPWLCMLNVLVREVKLKWSLESEDEEEEEWEVLGCGRGSEVPGG